MAFWSDLETAKSHLGITFDLKQKQIETLECLHNGHDCISVLPTGYGKSLIFQLLPWLLCKQKEPRIVLVTSPLNSLMQDQVMSLSEKGVKACFLDIEGRLGKTYSMVLGTSRHDAPESDDDEDGEKDEEVAVHVSKTVSLDRIQRGEFLLIYAHPEAFVNNKTIGSILRSKLYQQRVAAIVTDEVHMVSEWGPSFRTAFTKLSELTTLFPNAVHLAVTATATKDCIQKIGTDLQLKDPIVVSTNPDRENIYLEIRPRLPNIKKYEKMDDLVRPIAEELKQLRKEFPVTIVYHNNMEGIGYSYRFLEYNLGREQYEPIGMDLVENRLFAQFHSQTPEEMKHHIISELRKENPHLRLVFSTVALGMGLNAPAIVRIIHFQPPTTMEKYMQEIGRVGRMGQQSKAILYYNMSDIASNRKDFTKEMGQYCKSETCLRLELLRYFGYEEANFSGSCDMCCSNCAKSEKSTEKHT